MWIELESVRAGRRLGAGQAEERTGVSLQVERGDYVAILGPSGAGKSALLEVLGLLRRPDTGSYRLDGTRTETLRDAERARLRGRRIGIVLEACLLLPDRSLLENVELPLEYQRVDRAERRARAARVLAEIGLGSRLRRLPGSLSPGERRRAAVARACVGAPELLLADEPTRGLDGREADEILGWLEARCALGTTVVVATRDAARAGCARRLVHLRNGQLLRQLPPEMRSGSRVARVRTPRGPGRWR